MKKRFYFRQNLMNYLFCVVKLKEIVNLQDIIKTDTLRYKSKSRKNYIFSEYYFPFAFYLLKKHEGSLSLKNFEISKGISLPK